MLSDHINSYHAIKFRIHNPEVGSSSLLLATQAPQMRGLLFLTFRAMFSVYVVYSFTHKKLIPVIQQI